MKRLAALMTLSLLVLSGACSLSKSTAPPTPRPSGQATTTSAAEPVHSEASAQPSPAADQENDELHTPEKGSAERQTIMDALRGNQQIQFQVHYLKVHNGWCWVDTTPLDMNGRATAEGGPNLLHRENGNWRVMDLSRVPEDPNDPLGPDATSPTYVKNVMKTFPRAPRDIFPSGN